MIRDLAIGKAVVSGVCVSACTQKRGLEKWFLKMFAKFLLDIRFRIIVVDYEFSGDGKYNSKLLGI